MNFRVFVTSDACVLLPLAHQQRLARRAARKVLRMGRTQAIVIFPGPDHLQVTVNCQDNTIVISIAHQSTTRPTIPLIRKSA